MAENQTINSTAFSFVRVCAVCTERGDLTECCRRCQSCCWSDPYKCAGCAPRKCTLCYHMHGQTNAGRDFCAWVRTGPIFHRCFVCNASVPHDRCMATTICESCEKHGPPTIKT